MTYNQLKDEYRARGLGNPIGKSADALKEALEATASETVEPETVTIEDVVAEVASNSAPETLTLDHVVDEEGVTIYDVLNEVAGDEVVSAPEPETVETIDDSAPETEKAPSKRTSQRAQDEARALASMTLAEDAPALSQAAIDRGFEVFNVYRFKGVGGTYAKSGRCSVPNCRTGSDSEGRPAKGNAVYTLYPKAYCWEHALAKFRALGLKQPFASEEDNVKHGFAPSPLN